MLQTRPAMSSLPRTAALSACIIALTAAAALAQSGFRPPPADAAPEPSVTELVNGAVEIGAAEPAADAPVEAGVLTGRPVVRPVRVSAPPAIDGRLDDAAWRDAAQITEFVQLQPLDGAPATESTEVYLAYDSTSIYLAFRARYTDPAIIRANRSDRDTTFRDDLITVYFDTFLDQQRAYTFSVNAYGVQGDAIVSARGRGGGFGRRRGGGAGGLPRGDDSWDALVHHRRAHGRGRLHRGDGHPVQEPAVSAAGRQRAAPLGAADRPPHRRQGRDGRLVSGVARRRRLSCPRWVCWKGWPGLSTSRNIEILPTFTTIQFGSLDAASGGFVNRDPAPEGGVNFKYGVTSNLTADLTFNPDFSQIESDRPQIEVNERFAVFYPELRPFFLEGAEIFNIPGPVNAVHTRTIVDPLYGAKLTGKVGRTTVGVLYANDEAPGNADDASAAALGQAADVFVGRVRYDLYAESHIGAIVTSRDFLDTHSRLAGIEGDFRLGSTHSFAFRAMGTQHRDPDGNETSGHSLEAVMRKQGRNLAYHLVAHQITPDFKTDVGFVRRTDQRRAQARVSYHWWPETWLINWGPEARYTQNYAFDDHLQDHIADAGLNFNFAANLGFNTRVRREMERYAGVDFYKTSYRMFGATAPRGTASDWA